MRFFEQQRIAKKNSIYLVFLFTCAVAAIALITAAALTLVFYHMSGASRLSSFEGMQTTFWQIFFTTAVTVAGASSLRLLFPSSGDSIARSMGGQLLDRNATDPDERKLLNIVEEMSIASGVPVPPVYVLIHDNSINAFAAGTDSFHSVIAVTKGAMTVLTRDELQGVIGHEFSHIFHDDLKLNLRITATIFGLMMIANAGRFLLQSNDRSHRRNNKDSQQAAALGLVLFVMGYLGVFFSRMIQAAISRQREYLADASATQFTRNPLSLASALAKIHYLSGSTISASRNYEMDHYFFASAVSGGFLNSMFSTHPPVENRIKELYPQFNHQEFLKQISGKKEVQQYFEDLKIHNEKYSTQSFKEETLTDEAQMAFQSIANPTALHLGFAKKVVGDIPADINMAALSVFSAPNIIWAVLFLFQKTISLQELTEKNLINDSDKKEVEKYLIWLKENGHTYSALLAMSIASLNVLPIYEKKKFQEKLRTVFLMDGDFSFLEMLIYIYVQKILIPDDKTQLGGKTISEKDVKPNSHMERITAWVIKFNNTIITEEEQNKKYILTISNLLPAPTPFPLVALLSLDNLQNSTDALRKLNLIEKGKLVRILFEVVSKQDSYQTEALRFLCGILEVPVPAIMVNYKRLA